MFGINILMRDLINIIENKLSFDDAKKIVSDLEHSRGRIADVVMRNEWIVKDCQQAIKEKFGNSIDVFRAITLRDNDPLKDDGIVSTSLDVKVCYKMIENRLGSIIHGLQIYQTTNKILHYKISPDQVKFWVPHAMPFIRAAVGKRGNYGVDNRHGGKYKINKILDWIEKWDEKEVVADVSGLTPKVITFQANVRGNELFSLFGNFINNQPAEKYTYLSLDDIATSIQNFKNWIS